MSDLQIMACIVAALLITVTAVLSWAANQYPFGPERKRKGR